jgi:ABC-type polysaccharide/polyol phosphate export permease
MLRTLKRTWHRRAIVAYLVQRELTSSYRTRALGFAWAVLDPLAFMAVYYLVFGRILATRPPSFMLHLYIGIVAFHLLAKTTSQASGCISNQAGLIREISFPTAILPTSAVGARLFDFAVAWLVAIPLAFAFGSAVTWHWLLIPFIAVLQILFVAGIALMVAHVGVFFADIQNILGVVMRLWFYVTPILYPLSLMERKAAGYPLLFKLYLLNPMVSLVECYAALAQEARLPDPQMVLNAAVTGVAVFLLGLFIFSRSEGQLTKYV